MKGGYESIIWIKDKTGKEYACFLSDIKGEPKLRDDLSDEEKALCLDVSELIGTERW